MFPNRKRKGENMEPKIIGHRIKKLIENEKVEKKDLAQALSISEEELERKLEGEEEFYLSQIMQIKEFFHLNLETFAGIFFEPDFK